MSSVLACCPAFFLLSFECIRTLPFVNKTEPSLLWSVVVNGINVNGELGQGGFRGEDAGEVVALVGVEEGWSGHEYHQASAHHLHRQDRHHPTRALHSQGPLAQQSVLSEVA